MRPVETPRDHLRSSLQMIVGCLLDDDVQGIQYYAERLYDASRGLEVPT